MEPRSELNVLTDLGLTPINARVYWTLVKSGPLKTSALAEMAKVARPDTYRAIRKLQKNGLIEKIIDKPVRYKAISVSEALSLLLEIKREQYERVRVETEMLRGTINSEQPNDTNQIESSQFVLIPGGRTVIERINAAIRNAQLSMDFVLSWKRFSHGIASAFAESIEIAWAKKVKIRFIIQSPPKSKTAKQLVQFCRKPFCEIRLIRHHPKTVTGVYDKKEVLVVVDPKTDLPGSPALWSNNPGLIALAESYFEILWRTATKNIQ